MRDLQDDRLDVDGNLERGAIKNEYDVITVSRNVVLVPVLAEIGDLLRKIAGGAMCKGAKVQVASCNTNKDEIHNCINLGFQCQL